MPQITVNKEMLFSTNTLGEGCMSSPEHFGTFSREIAHCGANSVVF